MKSILVVCLAAFVGSVNGQCVASTMAELDTCITTGGNIQLNGVISEVNSLGNSIETNTQISCVGAPGSCGLSGTVNGFEVQGSTAISVTITGLTFTSIISPTILLINNPQASVTVSNCETVSVQTGTNTGWIDAGQVKDLTVTDSIFRNGDSPSSGGAIHGGTSGDQHLVVTNTQFISNTATTNGGAIYWAKGSVLFNGLTFTDNVDESGGDSAAVYLVTPDVTIVSTCPLTFIETTFNQTTVPELSDTCNPTANPTRSPTGSPTGTPTGTPTGSPSSSPTRSPVTPIPSASPTSSPSDSPTPPTLQPTSSPTSESEGLSTAAIIGISAGGGVLFLAVVAAVCFVKVCRAGANAAKKLSTKEVPAPKKTPIDVDNVI